MILFLGDNLNIKKSLNQTIDKLNYLVLRIM